MCQCAVHKTRPPPRIRPVLRTRWVGNRIFLVESDAVAVIVDVVGDHHLTLGKDEIPAQIKVDVWNFVDDFADEHDYGLGILFHIQGVCGVSDSVKEHRTVGDFQKIARPVLLAILLRKSRFDRLHEPLYHRGTDNIVSANTPSLQDRINGVESIFHCGSPCIPPGVFPMNGIQNIEAPTPCPSFSKSFLVGILIFSATFCSDSRLRICWFRAG